nr:reverse transcriptase domain-containing protein [Tanacetum cinerariifolium]
MSLGIGFPVAGETSLGKPRKGFIPRRKGTVAYRLDLPEELNGVHDTFYVSNLKKCLAHPTLQVPLDELRVDAKLNFIEEPMEILEREFKKMKRSRIAIVKFSPLSGCDLNLLEVKQHVSPPVKEIDYVQLGVVNQPELKL